MTRLNLRGRARAGGWRCDMLLTGRVLQSVPASTATRRARTRLPEGESAREPSVERAITSTLADALDRLDCHRPCAPDPARAPGSAVTAGPAGEGGNSG